MLYPISNLSQAFLSSLSTGLSTVMSYLPAVIGAILLLIIGWALASVVDRVLTTILARVGFEHLTDRFGINDFIARSGTHNSASQVIGTLAKWFVRLIFISAAAQALQLSAVTSLINQIIFFIPNLLVSVVVLMIGVMLGRFVGNLTQGFASELELPNPTFLASVAKVIVVAFASLIALDQIGIATSLVNALFYGIVAALALGAGLAFGLGGRDVTAHIWQRWYAKSSDLGTRLEHRARTKAAEAEAHAARTAAAQAEHPALAARPAQRRATP